MSFLLEVGLLLDTMRSGLVHSIRDPPPHTRRARPLRLNSSTSLSSCLFLVCLSVLEFLLSMPRREERVTTIATGTITLPVGQSDRMSSTPLP